MARQLDPRRRGEILGAARAVFAERGYASARIAEIAARAGVATGTVYLYFDSKEAIVVALAEDFFARLRPVIVPALEHIETRESIVAAVHKALTFVVAEGDLLRLLRLRVGLGEQQGAALPAYIALRADLTHLLAARIEQGAIRRYDPAPLADLLAGLVEWIAEISLMGFEVDLTRYERTLVTLLQHALLPMKGEE